MKKRARIIAMILVLVLAAGSFTGCFTYYLLSSGGGAGELIVFTIPLDIVTLPFQLIYLIVTQVQEAQRNKRGRLMDGVDTFSHTEKSLPKAKIDSLTQRFNSLPEAEIASYTQAVNSFSETEINTMIKTYNGLSEAEIISSIEALNSMPEEKLVSLMNNLQRAGFRKQN
jgi:hypothetical protein